MITFFIYLFTIFLILDCLLLGLLIMIQLPKKEAGVGVAFGGGATDALFGAGSGTALSNLTKYTATAFFILVFVLTILFNHSQDTSASALSKQVDKLGALPKPAATSPATPPPASGTTVPLIPLTPTNAAMSNAMPATNVPAAPAK